MNFEVKNGCFGYKKKQILNDISFSVNDGEVCSSGKAAAPSWTAPISHSCATGSCGRR